jgi:hypothetical protein
LLEGLDDESGDNEEDEDEQLFLAMENLYSDADFDEEEEEELQELTTAEEEEEEEDEAVFTHFPATGAQVPFNLNPTTLAKYRKQGPYGKLHNFGVAIRKSSQLKEQLFRAQRQLNPNQKPRAWVHNVDTRWSSSHDMIKRALELKPALNLFFINVEDQWVRSGEKFEDAPEVLTYQLTKEEWLVVASLQKILHQFAVSSKQLQGDISTHHLRSTTGGFDEYFPVVELLLDHLERAMEGYIIDEVEEDGVKEFRKVELFGGDFTHTILSFEALLMGNFRRNGPQNSPASQGLRQAWVGEASPLLREAHLHRLRCCCCSQPLQKDGCFGTPMESSTAPES